MTKDEVNNNHVPYRPGMTLLPGQSTSIPVEVPQELIQHFKNLDVGTTLTLEPVPPPIEALINPRAQELGLPKGLRVTTKATDEDWRCSQCWQIQHSAEQVWVPDGISRGDADWFVAESARRSAYNGAWSAWCLSCALTLSGRTYAQLHPTIPNYTTVGLFLTVISILITAILTIVFVTAIR